MASIERIRKVSEQIKRELSVIIPETIYHEKINFLSVTGIKLTRDFKFATVYLTLIGNQQNSADSLIDLLSENQGKIRHQLAKKLSIRTVPKMTFVYDRSVEYGAHMENLLKKINRD